MFTLLHVIKHKNKVLKAQLPVDIISFVRQYKYHRRRMQRNSLKLISFERKRDESNGQQSIAYHPNLY